MQPKVADLDCKINEFTKQNKTINKKNMSLLLCLYINSVNLYKNGAIKKNIAKPCLLIPNFCCEISESKSKKEKQ